MITLGDLMPVLEGLAILPNAPKIQDGHLQLYLKLLNERALDPPPEPAELQQAALDVLTTEKFFPSPAVLIEALRERRKDYWRRAERRIEQKREAGLERCRKQFHEWVRGLEIPPDAPEDEKLATIEGRMDEFEEMHGYRLEVGLHRYTGTAYISAWPKEMLLHGDGPIGKELMALIEEDAQ